MHDVCVYVYMYTSAWGDKPTHEHAEVRAEHCFPLRLSILLP